MEQPTVKPENEASAPPETTLDEKPTNTKEDDKIEITVNAENQTPAPAAAASQPSAINAEGATIPQAGEQIENNNDSVEYITDSDSDDDDHALNKSLVKIRQVEDNNQFYNSMNSSLYTVLSDEHAAARFPLLAWNRTMHSQKKQMIDLNAILKRYMEENTNLEEEMKDVCKDIEQCKKDRSSQEQELNGLVKNITKQKVEMTNFDDKCKIITREARVLDLKNSKLEKEVARAEKDIADLQRKIDELNGQIKEADEEIENDKNDIEKMEPKKNELDAMLKKITEENRMALVNLLRERKKTFLEPLAQDIIEEAAKKGKPGVDLEKALAHYRAECLREKRARGEPEDLVKLRAEYAAAEKLSKHLDVEKRKLETTEEQLARNLIDINSQIDVLSTTIEKTNLAIRINKEKYAIDLNKIDALVHLLEANRDRLSDEFKAANDYLLEVLLKDLGKKERIDKELRQMGILLNWSAVQQKVDSMKNQNNSESEGNKSGASSNKGSIRSKGSQKKKGKR